MSSSTPAARSAAPATPAAAVPEAKETKGEGKSDSKAADDAAAAEKRASSSSAAGPLRVMMMKGHGRALTSIKYNRDGDLLFSTAKDLKPCVWYADTGERLGTYNGHEGAVWDIDVNFDSTKLLTGSSDTKAKLWNVEDGRELFEFKHVGGVRVVSFSHGDRMIMTVQDSTFKATPSIFCYNLHDNIDEQSDIPVREMPGDPASGAINDALWGSLNHTIISAHGDGSLRVWDTETGAATSVVKHHTKEINSIQFSKDHTMLITASADQTSKVFDVKSMTLLKTYTSDRPLNAAAMSPTQNHVIVGGGQDAMHVTTTGARAGHFETDFFHTVYMEFLGSVKGHFGPIHALAFNPDGKSFASGSEDGYIRLHHFDQAYFSKHASDKF